MARIESQSETSQTLCANELAFGPTPNWTCVEICWKYWLDITRTINDLSIEFTSRASQESVWTLCGPTLFPNKYQKTCQEHLKPFPQSVEQTKIYKNDSEDLRAQEEIGSNRIEEALPTAKQTKTPGPTAFEVGNQVIALAFRNNLVASQHSDATYGDMHFESRTGLWSLEENWIGQRTQLIALNCQAMATLHVKDD